MKINRTTSYRMSAKDRRTQLLEVALEVFSRRGFKSATTKDIAAEAGVTEAVIFQHFASKEELYSAVLDNKILSRAEEAWKSKISKLIQAGDEEDLFRSLIEDIIRRYRQNPRFERVVLFAALEGHKQGLAQLEASAVSILGPILNYIAEKQRRGEMLGCDPQAILCAFGGIAHHYGIMTEIFSASFPKILDEKIAGIFSRILLDGIRPRKPAIKVKCRKAKNPS
jgi:TetR/AcrR family transcriptional regulator